MAVYGKGGSAPALPGQWTRCFWKVPAFRFLSRPVRGFGGQLGDSVGRVRRAQRPGASGRGPFGARSARRRGRFGGAARVAGASLPARPPPLPGAQARPPPPRPGSHVARAAGVATAASTARARGPIIPAPASARQARDPLRKSKRGILSYEDCSVRRFSPDPRGFIFR